MTTHGWTQQTWLGIAALLIALGCLGTLLWMMSMVSATPSLESVTPPSLTVPLECVSDTCTIDASNFCETLLPGVQNCTPPDPSQVDGACCTVACDAALRVWQGAGPTADGYGVYPAQPNSGLLATPEAAGTDDRDGACALASLLLQQSLDAEHDAELASAPEGGGAVVAQAAMSRKNMLRSVARCVDESYGCSG